MASRPRSLLMQLVGVVLGVVFLGVAVVLGAVVLAVLLGLLLLVAVVFYVRLWWLRRRAAAAPPGRGDQVIETEYTVVRTSERDRDRP